MKKNTNARGRFSNKSQSAISAIDQQSSKRITKSHCSAVNTTAAVAVAKCKTASLRSRTPHGRRNNVTQYVKRHQATACWNAAHADFTLISSNEWHGTWNYQLHYAAASDRFSTWGLFTTLKLLERTSIEGITNTSPLAWVRCGVRTRLSWPKERSNTSHSHQRVLMVSSLSMC